MAATTPRRPYPAKRPDGLSRGAFLGVVGLIVLTLVLVFADQAMDAYRGEQTVTAPQTVHNLWFEDREAGAVAVRTAPDAEPLAVLNADESSFVRTVVRHLAHVRDREGIGPEMPFQIVRWTDGTMIIADPATGQYMPLNGFGRDNDGAFRALVDAAATVR